ncbi:MAG: sulfatase-like hydrolase/transferase [Pirellulales bacterium]
MAQENILVIAVDGLRASALGAYGNTTYPTPALDQFAAQSLLADWCFVDAVELPQIYRQLWGGEPSLLKSLADRGYGLTLVTDDARVAELAEARAFNDCVKVAEAEPCRAEDIGDTALARVFAGAIEQVEAVQSELRLVWIHTQGMHGPWDAPLDLQEELLNREEGDPPPADDLAPPDSMLSEKSDPDTAFRAACAYAAQSMTLDACVAGVCDAIDAVGRENWIVVLCGLRGFPLGEHGRIGGVDGRLYAEQLHVPLVVRFADGRLRLSRIGDLVSLADLPRMLLAADDGELFVRGRESLVAGGTGGEGAIRTPGWSLVFGAKCDDSSDGVSDRYQLFVRPDDRWEANDVAALCPDVVEELLARLAASAGG